MDFNILYISENGNEQAIYLFILVLTEIWRHCHFHNINELRQCDEACSSRWLMTQLKNGQHACVLVFVPMTDIFNMPCDCQFVFSVRLMQWVIFKTPFTRYNRLSNGLYNRFDNRLNVCIHDTAGCQSGCQPVVSCIQTFTWLSNCLDNRFDNRLYRVNGA